MSIDSLEAAVSKLEIAIAKWAKDSEKAARIIEKLSAALLEIEEWAEDQYDGPEDKRMGWLIARCQDARGR